MDEISENPYQAPTADQVNADRQTINEARDTAESFRDNADGYASSAWAAAGEGNWSGVALEAGQSLLRREAAEYIDKAADRIEERNPGAAAFARLDREIDRAVSGSLLDGSIGFKMDGEFNARGGVTGSFQMEGGCNVPNNSCGVRGSIRF